MEKLLSHLAHLEIASPDVEASTRFYEEKFGMRIVDRVGDRVYLRCWGDYYHYSLVVVPGAEPALGSMAWRVSSPEALDAAARNIEETGVSGIWSEGGHRHGKSYVFTGPYGHTMKLFWEVDLRYWQRHCLKPGLSGLAQVRGYRGATDHESDLIDRLQSDLEYLEGWTIMRDIQIIFLTLRVLVHDRAF